jgi:hypothetical protein
MKTNSDILMFVGCKSCGETAKLHHQYWCACTCQNCSATIHNPLHDCEGKQDCFFGMEHEEGQICITDECPICWPVDE